LIHNFPSSIFVFNPEGSMSRTLKFAALALLGLGLSAQAQAGLSAKPKDASQSDRMVSWGYRYVAKDSAKGALKYFEKAVKADKGNAQAWQALGDAYAALGKDKKAQDAYEKGSTQAGSNIDAAKYQRASRYSAQAFGYLAKDNYTAAVHYFKAALADAPDYSHAQAGLDEISARAAKGDKGAANSEVKGDEKDMDSDDGN
jgi:Tfp pilus assembly protein PilF